MAPKHPDAALRELLADDRVRGLSPAKQSVLDRFRQAVAPQVSAYRAVAPSDVEIIGRIRQLRYLRAFSYDIEQAAAKYADTLLWRTDHRVHAIREQVIQPGVGAARSLCAPLPALARRSPRARGGPGYHTRALALPQARSRASLAECSSCDSGGGGHSPPPARPRAHAPWPARLPFRALVPCSVAQYVPPDWSTVSKYWQIRPLHCYDLTSSPVMIERVGRSNLRALLTDSGLDKASLLVFWTHMMEWQVLLLDRLSDARGELVRKAEIRDLDGLGIGHTYGPGIDFFKACAGVTSKHYVEIVRVRASALASSPAWPCARCAACFARRSHAAALRGVAWRGAAMGGAWAMLARAFHALCPLGHLGPALWCCLPPLSLVRLRVLALPPSVFLCLFRALS
jgi:hypothetical protein